MKELSVEQIRNFRLHAHHLDKTYKKSEISCLVGACGMQNSPPGAWETALYNRVPDCSLAEMNRLLYQEKSLLQAWSFRGTPVVFPTGESDVFLTPLLSKEAEPWIYTNGISLALDFLQMSFAELMELLIRTIPQLDTMTLLSKTTLDQTLADWMLPYLPHDKQALWNQPSMYGSPHKQTAGGAVVSFLLRPCSFYGLVVFGERKGITPSFTSYQNWTGHAVEKTAEPEKHLVRKFLHCYGPATVDAFIRWLGCSGKQGRRLWNLIAEEIKPVTIDGKKAFLLSEDIEKLYSVPSLSREYLLLGGHDPYLDQRDRIILQSDKSRHKQIWTMVSNPGAILYHGEIIGIWTGTKKNKGMEITMTLWQTCQMSKLHALAEEYAAFRQQKLIEVKVSP